MGVYVRVEIDADKVLDELSHGELEAAVTRKGLSDAGRRTLTLSDHQHRELAAMVRQGRGPELVSFLRPLLLGSEAA